VSLALVFFFFFFVFFGYFELSIYAEQREKKKMSDVRPRNRRSQKGIIKRSLTICALSILLFASRVVSEAINGRVVEEGDRTQREEEDTKKLYRGGGGVNFFDAPFGDVNAKDVPSNNNNNNNNNAGVSVAAFAPRRALQVSARAFRSFLLTKVFSWNFQTAFSRVSVRLRVRV
jgi:hypothetical protein